MGKTRALNAFPLFQSLSAETCENLINSSRILKAEYNTGDVITNGSIYCILKGTLSVLTKSENNRSVVRYLKEGDVFGVASVFAKDPNLSVIRAEGKVRLISISKETVLELLNTEPDFLSDYLSFLSDRIAFLNSKISTVTAGTAEAKLARWLDVQAETDTFLLPVSMSDLAKLLDLGRASLYRALEELEEKACIRKEGNTIHILDRALLRTLF